MSKPICCGREAKWIENIAGKGYNYCGECKKEVLTPVGALEEPPALAPTHEYTYIYYDSASGRIINRATQDASDDDDDTGDSCNFNSLYDPNLRPQD